MCSNLHKKLKLTQLDREELALIDVRLVQKAKAYLEQIPAKS
jgi:hypothetical protein